MKTIIYFMLLLLPSFVFATNLSADSIPSAKNEKGTKKQTDFIKFEIRSGVDFVYQAPVEIRQNGKIIFKGVTDENGEVLLSLTEMPYDYMPVDIVVAAKGYISHTINDYVLYNGQRFFISLNPSEQ